MTMATSYQHQSRSAISILSILFLFIALSSATKICRPYPPIKRQSLMTSTAIASATLFPRGGAAKLTTTTSSPPVTATNSTPLIIFKSFVQTIINAKSHLYAAAVARCVSIFGMYPVDTIKTRMQMKQGDAFRIAGLYSGVTGSLVGQVPYG